MKHTPSRIIPFASLMALLITPSLVSAQAVSVATWLDDKAGAVSLTFDDALSGHWSHADPIMNSAGVRGTFFVITGSTDWNGARAAALNGHEIGSHSTVDATLKDDANAALKMQQSHNEIEAQIGSAITGYQCHSIAWPYGFRRLDVINDPLYHNLYVSARNAGNTLLASNSYNSPNTTAWWKYGLGTYGLDHFFVIGDALMFTSTSLSTFEAQLDLVEANNAWTVFTYHGIETGGYQNISAANFTDQVNALAARMDSTLWAAPYGEVARYVRQRDDASASVQSNNGTTVTISLTDTLDDGTFNLPLTLLFDAPAGWTQVTATQNGAPIEASVVSGTVRVNAVPDAGTITVTQAATSLTAPVPTLTIASGTDAEVHFDSEPGLNYQLQKRISLTAGDWANVPGASLVGNGAPQVLSDTNTLPDDDEAFYQILVTE